jgi:putative transcriptional regulator
LVVFSSEIGSGGRKERRLKLPGLKEVRELHGWSQAKLAEESGVSRDSISNYETGHREPWPATAKRLADALGVEIEELARPKVTAPSTSGQLEEKIPDEERHAKYLRAWRGFVWKLVHRWEADPPKTSREIAVILDTMQAIVDEGAFGLPPGQITTSNWREASEGIELQALFLGLQRLNDIADTVKGDETAQQRRDLLKALPGGLSA